MRVLMVNKFFYIKGGSETYYFALKKLLEENGHEVIDFSMKDEKNFESPYSKFFVDNVDYNKKQSIIKKVKSGLKIIYSFEAKRKIEKLIKEIKPDIAHLHIFQHQLSSSIIDVLKKYNIPIVYTAHDLKMICPNYKMLTKGQVCEQCKKGKYYNCLKNKCIKESTVKSAIGMTEAYFNKIKKSYDNIDKIITPSKFYKDKFIDFGVEGNKVTHIPNFLKDENVDYEAKTDEKYVLYFGRLSEEKGIMTLIKSMEHIEADLKIVGTGPLKEIIKDYVNNNQIENVKLLGFKSGKDLNTLIANAKAVILPSEWYENGPYTAIESLRLSIPLIGSDLGGIPELIEEGKNGYIFSRGNVEELHNKIQMIISQKDNELQEMKKESRKIYLENYTENVHYEKLIKIYEEILTQRGI